MIGASSGVAREPGGVEQHQHHDAQHRQHQAAQQPAPLQGPRAEIRNRRPGRHGERIGAEQPDHIGQAPARRSRAAHRAGRTTSACAAPARWRRANPASSSNSPIAAEVVSSSRPASIDHANHALRRFWPINLPGMQQQQRPERARQHQRAEFDAGRTEGHDRHRQQHRKHRLLPADNGARQLIEASRTSTTAQSCASR